MNSHNPFNTGGSCGPGDFNSRDQLVDRLIGDSYKVVKEVYLRLGQLEYFYNFLNTYHFIVPVASNEELRGLDYKSVIYARVYGKQESEVVPYYYIDYLYVEGNLTGILPNESSPTGSWIAVGSSGSGSNSLNRTWFYTAEEDGQTVIKVPTDVTVTGVQVVYVSGQRQDINRGFSFNANTGEITLADALEKGEEVTAILGLYDPENDLDIFTILSGMDGATLIGTKDGKTVQDALEDIVQKLADLSAGILGLKDTGVKLTSLVTAPAYTTQAQLNNQFVNVLRFGSRGAFGTAMNAAIAYALTNGITKVFVPGGDYTLDQSVTATLSRDLQIVFDPGAVIICDNPMDVFQITAQAFLFDIRNMRAFANWSATDNQGAAVIRFTGRTLRHNLRVYDLMVEKSGTAGSPFKYGLFAVGANASQIIHPNISAATYPIWLESSNENTATALVANSMEPEIVGMKFYNCVDGITVVNNGYYGCEGVIIRDGKIVASEACIRFKAGSTLRSSYIPPLVQIQSMHLNGYWGATFEKVSRVFLDTIDLQSKYNPTDTVLGMFEFASTQGITMNNITFTGVGYQSAVKANINTAIYFKELDSNLPSAFISIDNSKFWLDGMTSPLIDSASSSAFSGRVVYGGSNIKQAMAPIILRAYRNRIQISPSIYLDSYDVGQGLGYQDSSDAISYDSSSGVLTLNSRAGARDLFFVPASIVPNGAVINQIIANNIYGRQLTIQIQAAEVTLVHGTNLINPSYKTQKMWLPTFFIAEFLNNQQCRIVTIGGDAVRRPMLASAPTAATTGTVGDWYLSGTTLTQWMPGLGWYNTTVAKLT